MSSGFVSGGTDDKPIERDDEWLKAQQEIEAARRRKDEESRQQGGKTLYEVLQGNKAAKQEAFEESIKLKNQFRNLDEDEIDFLDSVLESTRQKEEAVKKETTEQLDLFRRQQEEADKALLDESGATEAADGGQVLDAGESQWALNARKRKRVKEKEVLKGVKLRKSSTNETPITPGKGLHEPEKETTTLVKSTTTQETASNSSKNQGELSRSPGEAISAQPAENQAKALSAKKQDSRKPAALPGLGLAAYSSEEED